MVVRVARSSAIDADADGRITEDEFLNPLQLRAGSAADFGEDT